MADYYLVILFGSGLILLVYGLLLMYWLIRWLITPETEIAKNFQERISVIVAVRNEKVNIESLIDSLSSQDYNKELYEVLISDDQSEDETVPVALHYIEAKGINNIKILSGGKAGSSGKKAALERAIKTSEGNIIVTTDADCKHSPSWLSTLVSGFTNPDVKLISGMVILKPATGFFKMVQGLEFLGVVSSGLATFSGGRPYVCNGSNLAFRKSVLHEIDLAGEADASGDDTYLMLAVNRKFKNALRINKSHEGIVYTPPAASPGEMIAQRLRWASKIGKYRVGYITGMALFLSIAGILPLVFLILALSGIFSWYLAVSLAVVKILTDLIFIIPFAVFSGQTYLLLIFLPYQFIYPFYVIAGLILTMFKSKYKWKGRSYSVK